MRKLMARGFMVEFVSLVALIFAVALAWLGDLLKLPTAVVISGAVGITVAAYIWALKWEMRREIRDSLSLYNLLESIEDEELYDRGRTAIEECRVELENLSRGLLRIEPGQWWNYAIKITDAAKHHVRLTHVGLDEGQLELMQPVSENRWYQHNLNMVKRGVMVERIFILPRSKAIDSTSGKLKPSMAEVLDKQARDGIKVRVVWEETIDDPELIQEFIVVDTRLAVDGFKSWSGAVYGEARVLRRRFDIERYIERFEALRARGHVLSDLGHLLPTSPPG
ncbi:MAG: hypothetical protein GTO63_27945 [Anaerolineae bacterium]|nr:hypothetical protein [Anaerolineae bacterium]NIN98577.1 hypothetical protein [Anaerolineae bacterium]NIQ81461.1 hypothetical protein [Anaerolineae bacterium]